MVKKPTDANSLIDVDLFDVFRVEGDIDRLHDQRFVRDRISPRKIVPGVQSARNTHDQKITTDAQRLIQYARFSQQQALKDLHVMSELSGLSISRDIIDSQGPAHQRERLDGTGPEHQRVISDAEGPVLSSYVRLASLHEPITRARAAQQNALKEIHAIKDVFFSSSASQQDRLGGPINVRKLSDASGPILSSISSAGSLPADRANLSTDALLNRIKKARAEQQEAFKQLHALQGADGPIKDRAMLDWDLSVEKAKKSQLTALSYMKKVEDAVGPLVNTQWTDAEPQTDPKALMAASGPVRLRDANNASDLGILSGVEDLGGPGTVRGIDDSTGPTTPKHADDAEGRLVARDAFDASGPSGLRKATDTSGPLTPREATDTSGALTPREATDASGPLTPREATDASGPLTPREATDASGPLTPRTAIDAAGPNAPNSLDDAIGPTDRRTITDAKGPTLFHRIIEAVLPKKAVSVTRESPIEIAHHQSSIAERIAKVKADQQDAIQQLDDLDKENDKPLL